MTLFSLFKFISIKSNIYFQHIRHINARQDKNIWVDREFRALSESIIACLKIYFHSDYILKKGQK